jgi:PAS domain S-box-containing protein
LRQQVTDLEPQRKQAKESLQRSKDLFRALTESFFDNIVIVDSDGKTIYVSPSIKHLFGYEPEELIGKAAFDLIHPDDLQNRHSGFAELLQAENNIVTIELRIKHKGGSWRTIECRGKNLLGNPSIAGIVIIMRDITEQKQLKNEYRQLLENMKDGYAVLQGNTIIFANKRFSEIYGYEPEQVIGLNMVNFISLDNVQEMMELYTKVINGLEETPEEIVLMGIKRDGTTFPVQASIKQIKHNGTTAYSAIVKDLTEQKLIEETAGRSREYFQALIENAYDAIIILDNTGAASYISPSIKYTLGYDPEEILAGGNLFELAHPEDIQRLAENFTEGLTTTGRTISMELRIKHKDGSWRHIEGTGTNLLEHPSIHGFVCNLRDVTDRKLAENRFKELLGDINDGYAIYQDDTIILANNGLANMLGYTIDEMLGKKFSTFMSPTSLLETTKEYKRVTIQEGEAQTRYEITARKKDRTDIILDISVKTVEYGSKPAISCTLRDITEQKKAQEKLRTLYEAELGLRQALEEEKERKTEFTRVLVHELRTPLTSVMSSSEALLEVLTEGTLKRLAININRGAINLSNRVDDLLDLAKGDLGTLQLKFESVDLLKLIRKVAEYMNPVASSYDQFLILDLPQSLPLIQADVTRLQQVMLNLLNNASKFTPSGGKITIRAGRKDSTVIVEVEDTGAGISEEQRQRLFEPYYRVESDRQILNGLGLGLALCKTLVNLHGGQIWVDSRPGQGSTFYFSLPIEDA